MPYNYDKPFSVEAFNKYWNSLTITDDFIFCRVFQDEALCKEMLEILLDVKIHHLEYPDAQKSIKSSHSAKGIRLDVFVQDSNRVFDVEIQNADKGDIPLRTRYYHSTMDTSLLKKGNLYTNLKESYVIFLCKFDPLKKGQPIYKFQMRDEENPTTILGDKTYTLLYNMSDFAKLKEGERKDFLNYLAHGVRDSSFTSKLEKRVSEVKNDEDWRADYMTLEMKFQEREREAVATATLAAREEGMQRGMEQGIAVGREEGISLGEQRGARQNALQTACNLKNMGFPLDKIAKATGLSLEEIKSL